MTDNLLRLSTGDLDALASVLRLSRLQPPFSAIALQRVVQTGASQLVSADLNDLARQGFSVLQIATLCEAISADRSSRLSPQQMIELVTTGPEQDGAGNRDTGVVVRELFAQARHSVLISGYAVYQGDRVFQTLADRMHADPGLQVRMFLDVQRPLGDTSSESELVRRFSNTFRKENWPAERTLPNVYYFPRSLIDGQKKACLHAKCVVIDETSVFVSSANFTEAAQERNIEVGLLIRLPLLASQITQFFNNLIALGAVRSTFY